MARTLQELAVRTCEELDEDVNNSVILSKIKKFFNGVYKDVARKEGIEKSIDASAIDHKIVKPADFFKISKVVCNGLLVDCEEEETNILVPYNGDMKLFYFYIPDDLTDSETPKTNAANDGLIISGTKYVYLQSEGQYGKSEVHNRDYNTQPIKKIHKSIQFRVER